MRTPLPPGENTSNCAARNPGCKGHILALASKPTLAEPLQVTSPRAEGK